MNTEEKHAKLPWHRDGDGRIVDSKGQTVRFVDLAMACGYVQPGDEARGNTELMFRACNAYEPMLAAHKMNMVTLGNVLEWLEKQAKASPEIRAIIPHVREALETTEAAITKATSAPGATEGR